MECAKATGRWRHRAHRGLLVLQIEERGLHSAYYGGFVDTDEVVRWRDAKVEDLTASTFPLPAHNTDASGPSEGGVDV